MNKLQTVFAWIARILVIVIALISFVFVFVEGRKLIAGDFLSDQSTFRSFMTYFSRALGFLFMAISNILGFFATIRKFREKVIIWALLFAYASLVVPFCSFFYLETIVAIMLLFVSLISAAYQTFNYLSHKKVEE